MVKKITLSVCVTKEMEKELREEAKALNISLSSYASMIFAKRGELWKN